MNETTAPPIPDEPDERPSSSHSPQHSDRSIVANHVVESLQTVLTALMLAFMFRAFFVEAFIIPTGSMAQSLLGQHGVLVCPTCGWEFDYGPRRSVQMRDTRFKPPGVVYCPNCHTETRLDPDNPIARGGDRILVHKWPYLLGGALGPRRWDVIVFRDPANGMQNYIKRLVALPGESIEIVDGDVFIKSPDGDEFHIARKTPAAQSQLWFLVYDQGYAPAIAQGELRTAWSAERGEASGWSGLPERRMRFEAPDNSPHAIAFDPIAPFPHHYFQDVYAYNHGSAGHFFRDARIQADVTAVDGGGWLRFELARDGRTFTADFHRDGRIRLAERNGPEDETTLNETVLPRLFDHGPNRLELGILDYRAYVAVDGKQVLCTTDEQYSPNISLLRDKRPNTPIGIRIVAANMDLELDRLRIDRDVYYAYRRSNTRRAYADHAFTLGSDEFFVLGDNSPNSHDGREWARVGAHLRQAVSERRRQIGAVPRDQIVGRAFFVYLPGLTPLDREGRWRVPDVGRMRFIR